MSDQTDRERWDARYAKWTTEQARGPDPLVAAAVAALSPAPKSAYDLAAGAGRHALWLAVRGVRVQAWDVSPVGLELIERRAQRLDVTVETRVVDLAGELPLAPPRDLVLVVDYLDRALFARLGEWVAPGGAALVCTFTDAFPGEHPSRRFRLRPGELRELPGLSTVRAQEGGGRALLVAKKE